MRYDSRPDFRGDVLSFVGTDPAHRPYPCGRVFRHNARFAGLRITALILYNEDGPVRGLVLSLFDRPDQQSGNSRRYDYKGVEFHFRPIVLGALLTGVG